MREGEQRTRCAPCARIPWARTGLGFYDRACRGPTVSSIGYAAAMTAGSVLALAARAWRASDLASTDAVLCVPALNRTDDPRLTAVWAAAKYRPGMLDSPARYVALVRCAGGVDSCGGAMPW